MLTKKQKNILSYIEKFIEKNNYSPSLKEVAKHFKSSISTIHEHRENLKNKGYLKKISNKPRSIELVNAERIGLVKIPILGTISAGRPIEAIENKETIKVQKNLLAKSGEHFALRVEGNSMIEDGISNGDTVVIRKQPSADNGETVVALLNGDEVTLKKIFKEDNGFRLQPANPDVKPIFVKKLEVQGKVVSIIRNFDELVEEVSEVKQNKSSAKKNKKLNINFKKTCACADNHINCLDAKNWMKNQVAIWEFSYEKRDIRDKDIHPAVFPISLPKKCIELFTHKGELVLDPFSGIGTSLLAAKDTERNAIGFDLGKQYTKFTNTRLNESIINSNAKQMVICDDSMNISEYLDNNTISLSITSPPYANMLNRPRKNKSLRGNLRNNKHLDKVQQYSKDPRDLGTMEPKEFAKTLGEIYKRMLPLHKPGAHCVINITDLWWEGKRIPLHIYVIEEMQKAGYEFRNTIIWDRRNLVNGAGIFGWPSNYITLGTTLEYILDFWRPKESK